MKRTLASSFVCVLLLWATQCSEAQAPSRPDSLTRKTAIATASLCEPGIHGFPVKPTLQQIVDEVTSLRERIDVLACAVTLENDMSVHAEQELYDAVGVALAQSSATDYSAKLQSLKDRVDSLQSDLTRANQTITQLCSAIRFALAMNGTSATSSGGELWNACN